jgi:hypothetical protein
MSRDFWAGVGAGVAGAAIAVHLWLAVLFDGMRHTYADFGGSIPASTRLVLSATWRWGIPGAGVVALSLLVSRRARSAWPYGVLAIVLVLTAVATYLLAEAPLYALAGNIKGD